MKDYVLKNKPEPAAHETVWAFDLGKGSIGDCPSPRWGEGGRRPDEVNKNLHPQFLHKAFLLIPAEFAETKTVAGRRRMWRTRQAHGSGQRGIVSVVTGGGKTFFALKCINEFQRRVAAATVLITVPTEALLDQWFEELISFFDMPPRFLNLVSRSRPIKRGQKDGTAGADGGFEDIQNQTATLPW